MNQLRGRDIAGEGISTIGQIGRKREDVVRIFENKMQKAPDASKRQGLSGKLIFLRNRNSRSR
jgi:hypothetical protein